MNYLLIGRPNVGKSSIYNILIGQNINIIHKNSGTTRDWHKNNLFISKKIFIYDAPGIFNFDNIKKYLNENILYKNLFKKIDSFLYVIDYKNINLNNDLNEINEIRKLNKEIILIVNKFDNFKIEKPNIIKKFGLNEIFYTSCTHKIGFEKLFEYFKKKSKNILYKEKNIFKDFSIAIFGKPNSGKSTLLNSIIGYERAMTNNKAGTTSDLVKENFIFKKTNIEIYDTAGIPKKSKISKDSINYHSINKSFNKINDVDVAILLIDSKLGISRQDKRIINIVINNAKNIIIIFNKIDLIEKKNIFKREKIEEITNTLSELKNIKIFFCSAFSKNHTFKIVNYIDNYILNNKKYFNTGNLNKWLKKAINRKSHPLIQNKKVNFKYVVQIKDSPITIKIFCNFSNKIRKDYKTFLIKNFNEHFNIINKKINIVFSTVKNPFI